MRKRQSMEQYIAAYADHPDECWLWTGQVTWNGYGRCCRSRDGVTTSYAVHRLAYELTCGPIPAEMTLDHLCNNRRCFNPSHLTPATLRNNVLRSETGVTAINARKTHCVNGHEFKDGNYWVQQRKQGPKRRCRVCDRERDRARRARVA